MQSVINNSHQFELECWDTKQEYLCSRKNHINVPGIDIKNHGDMQTLNTIVQNIQTHLNKHKTTNPVNV